MAGWSSLPADLINRIADRLLATDDLDYYMDLRAVCRGWRSSTADPKSSPRDPRFRPRQWAMLDEVHQSDARLFVNASTGRFVLKDLPLLRRYFVVAGAAGGSVVLAERTAPHAARVLNPFTGAMVSFEAPVPSEGKVAAHVIGSSPTLVLLSDHSIYRAHPDSKSFAERKEEDFDFPPVRIAVKVGIYAAAREDASLGSLLVLVATKIMELAAKPFAECFPGAEAQAVNRCFLVESAGEMLIVLKMPHRVEVYKFKMDTGSYLLERVKNLGSRALSSSGTAGACPWTLTSSRLWKPTASTTSWRSRGSTCACTASRTRRK